MFQGPIVKLLRKKGRLFDPAYRCLLAALGRSFWWPAETPFEVMVGAVLTQNTSWSNASKAIESLKEAGVLDAKRMHTIDRQALATLIRSSGYYNQKAQTLIHLTSWLSTYDFSLPRIKATADKQGLRAELLAIKGVGPETADSILCYALELPFFVVDAYTKRWLARYRPTEATGDYETLRHRVEQEFRSLYDDEAIVGHFNEFHALLVRLSNQICLKRSPMCAGCPLVGMCRKGSL